MAENQNKKNPLKNNPKNNYQIWLLVAMVLVIVGLMYFSRSNSMAEASEGRFKDMMSAGDVQKVMVINKQLVEVTLTKEAVDKAPYKEELTKRTPFSLATGPHYVFEIISSEDFKKDIDAINVKLVEEGKDRVEIGVDNNRGSFISELFNWGFILLMIFGFWFLMRRMSGGGAGGQIFNIGKSKAALFDAENKIKTTFDDVAGLDEAKEEVEEVVQFLKNPSKYTSLGGKIPKGVLLVGPPGTGKTSDGKSGCW